MSKNEIISKIYNDPAGFGSRFKTIDFRIQGSEIFHRHSFQFVLEFTQNLFV